MTQGVSFCSFWPTRQAAIAPAASGTRPMMTPSTGMPLSRAPAAIAINMTHGLKSPSLANTSRLYTGTHARQRPCTPALSKIFIRNHEPMT